MDELDLFRTFRRGVAAPSADAQQRASSRLASTLEEAIGRVQPTRWRHGGHRRRLGALATAALVVVVGTASAYGTARVLFREGPVHVVHARILCEGERGTFYVELRFPNTGTRSWKVVPVVGPYAQITGGGRIPRVGGHARAWRARLEGFLTLRNGARQRVVITIKGRPDGGFELTPLQPGILRRDSGTQSSAWSG